MQYLSASEVLRFPHQGSDSSYQPPLASDSGQIKSDKGKNIVNILSNGQISVFMLAHFFAGINVRNDREKMKVYFIDDLTACMDDVNMLVFMDLLKYQMSSKATMEQLFFITCDDRISNLLKYKLSGREIELCELLEADLVQVVKSLTKLDNKLDYVQFPNCNITLGRGEEDWCVSSVVYRCD